MLSDPDRSTAQFPLPLFKGSRESGRYDIYPAHPLTGGRIGAGYPALAEHLAEQRIVIIDGVGGVFFDEFRTRLDQAFRELGVRVHWVETAAFLKPESAIDELIAPFLGGSDPLFGRRATLDLTDFYTTEMKRLPAPEPGGDLTILIGPGAALSGWDGFQVYVDLPKNEIQYRSRAGRITNLGARAAADPKAMYKRFYFVDWIVLNRHKKRLQPRIDLYIDGQCTAAPTWASGVDIRRALQEMAVSVFRCRPWFEPGTWGGNWIRDHIPGLSLDVPNYAWSFELIVPENGLLFENGGRLLELSFDTLMFQEGAAVLGRHHPKYGDEFPIRFDFLDTCAGGNLSIQCHPLPDYMSREFGEHFTQEECYYILDARPGACCHMGFQRGIERRRFRDELSTSFREHIPLEIDRFVQRLPSRRHDFFLIPPGTIHGSGPGNLVLEISTTPYIFTFKLYDWLRPDLDGRLRPLNIERGLANLQFRRSGKRVQAELVSRPRLRARGGGWEAEDLPTHPRHTYAVRRYRIETAVNINCDERCHVLNLVEGGPIILETAAGTQRHFHYAETFVVPAAAGSYRIVNESSGLAMVVAAFMK